MKNNKKQPVVKLKRLYKDEDWKDFNNETIIPIGAETETHNLLGTLENSFNLLVGGKSGSGKSIFFRCVIASLLQTTDANNLRLILIDTKKTEFSIYDNVANLIHPVIIEVKEAMKVFDWCIQEIDGRVELFSKNKVDSIEEYRKRYNKELPRLLIIIDEYADLMDSDFWFFDKAISYIVKNGQSAGVNIIIGTSKISDSGGYTKKLAEFFPFRIAFATSTAEESKDILGVEGAEKLQGKGDLLMLYPEIEIPVRVQGFFVSEKEIEKIKKQYDEINVFRPQSFIFKFLWKYFPNFVVFLQKLFQHKSKK